MPTKEEMIKGLDALYGMIKEQAQLGRDGLIFIHEQGLWDKFMAYHCEEFVKRGKKD